MNRILQRLAKFYDENKDYNGYGNDDPSVKSINDFLAPRTYGVDPSTYYNIAQEPYEPKTLPKINKSNLTLTELRNIFNNNTESLEEEIINIIQEKIAKTQKPLNNIDDVIDTLCIYISRSPLMTNDLISAVVQDYFFDLKQEYPNLKVKITYEDLKSIFNESLKLQQLSNECIERSQENYQSRLTKVKKTSESRQKKAFYKSLPDKLSFQEYIDLLSPDKEKSFNEAVKNIIAILNDGYRVMNRNGVEPTTENIKKFVMNYGGQPWVYNLRADLATPQIYEEFKKYKSANSLQFTTADINYFFKDPRILKQIEKTKQLVREEYARLAAK